MINGWFPKKQAATAVGFLSAGSPLGGAVAGPIVGYGHGIRLAPGFYDYFRYRYCMDDSVVFIAANSPEKHKKSAGEELKLINKMKEEEVALETIENQTAHSLGYYLKQPIILVTAFAFFCYNYILFFFSAGSRPIWYNSTIWILNR